MPPISDQFGVLLQGCMKSKALRPGKQLHAQLLATGTDTQTTSFNSKLVRMYAASGDTNSAHQLFDRMPEPTVFAWNWMISALAFQGHCNAAMGFFSQMQKTKVFPNQFTFSSVLKACVGMMDMQKGRELHCVVIKSGFGFDVSVANALIDMYCKCGRLDMGRKVFDDMSGRDVASWTSMICGYSHAGELEHSLILFERMKADGLEPNDFTWNVMISGYANNGDCNGAFEMFSRMRCRGLTPGLVTWNAMISGFVRSNRYVEAMTLFEKMLGLGIKPNPVTIAALLPACGSSGAIDRGREVHGLIYRRLLNHSIFIATALIDMYSKCGYVQEAHNVFNLVEVKKVASWNAMIGCYGKHGLVSESILLLDRMIKEGVEPNQITYTTILSACSHAGLVDQGLEVFNSMKEKGSVELCKEHYACMVDLLSRAEKLEEAYELMKKIPMEINESIVGAFLNGCKIHGRSDLGKKMAEDILGMELKRPGGFVTLSNIYAAKGEWDWVQSVRRVMKEKGVCKKAGFSWVEKKNLCMESMA